MHLLNHSIKYPVYDLASNKHYMRWKGLVGWFVGMLLIYDFSIFRSIISLREQVQN